MDRRGLRSVTGIIAGKKPEKFRSAMSTISATRRGVGGE